MPVTSYLGVNDVRFVCYVSMRLERSCGCHGCAYCACVSFVCVCPGRGLVAAVVVVQAVVTR
jgi:hypothetical protein